MKPLLVLAVLSLLASSAVMSAADEPVRVNNLSGNVKARLIAAKRSQGRAALLIARFEPLDGGKEIQVVFPAHSFTTHEATLKAVIVSFSDWGDSPDHSNWSKVRGEAIFSLPAKGANFSGGSGMKSLDHCYLVSLKLPAGK